ncbi:MAG: hypothetical protein IPL79_03645 [Myxococcales bacterium]|nr:hypothetical protein [Myxococcales bacterium]
MPASARSPPIAASGALPASLQTLALFEYGGELVNANRGLIEYDDLLKRPLESYKYLLTTVERGAVSLANSALSLDVLYMASSNETHVAAFKEYPDFQSFRGRFAFVRAPYLLSVSLERQLYKQRLREAAGSRHVAPHTDYVLALFAVLTRMRKPQLEHYPQAARELIGTLTPLAKADLYADGRVPAGVAGEAAKRLRQLTRDLVAESDEYPHYEGKYGASPREMLAILMAAASSTKFSYVSPFVVLDELAQLIKQTSLYEYLRLEPDGGFHDHVAMLQAVRDRLAELVERDVQDALGLVADAEHAKIFERYMMQVTHWVRGEKLRNASTGNMEAPDVRLMEGVEESLGQSSADVKRFREALVTKVGAWSVDHPGQRPNFEVVFAEEHERLQAAYYGKVRSKIATGLEALLQSLAGHAAPEISQSLQRLYDKGYHEASARDLLGFCRPRGFAGSA